MEYLFPYLLHIKLYKKSVTEETCPLIENLIQVEAFSKELATHPDYLVQKDGANTGFKIYKAQKVFYLVFALALQRVVHLCVLTNLLILHGFCCR